MTKAAEKNTKIDGGEAHKFRTCCGGGILEDDVFDTEPSDNLYKGDSGDTLTDEGKNSDGRDRENGGIFGTDFNTQPVALKI